MKHQILGTLASLAVAAAPAGAVNHLVVLDEILGSWQGSPAVQFVELRMVAAGQGQLSRGASLVFEDQTGTAGSRRFFTFQTDVGSQAADARILVGTQALFALTGVQPDFVLPSGVLRPAGGRVCYAGDDGVSQQSLDCVAYGGFAGPVGSFGAPIVATPENRALQRVAASGVNRDDFQTTLTPTPRNNAGATTTLLTLCGNEQIEQGEDCDGTNLGQATCGTLGFAPGGTLRCQECHFDTSGCSSCGDGHIDRGEQCDLADLGGRTCPSLGFTGGNLACTGRCKLTTAACDPTYFVPGGGPVGTDCLAEWRLTNAAGRPGSTGKAPVRQVCRDGDVGCDADVIAGQCTFAVALCFARNDARLVASGQQCRAKDVADWTLLRPGAPLANELLSAAGALGASSVVDTTVTFAPPLDGTERCSVEVAAVVPRPGTKAGKLTLRARTSSSAGRRDLDTLRLVCTP